MALCSRPGVPLSRGHSAGDAGEGAAQPRRPGSEDVGNLQLRCVRLRLSCRAKWNNTLQPAVGGRWVESEKGGGELQN